MLRERVARFGAVENPSQVDAVVRGEVAEAERRARKAGARGALRYVGAGASGIVFCDARRAFKVSRWRKGFARDGFTSEAEWLQAANRNRIARKHVAKFYRYHPGLMVIERECVEGRRGRWSDGTKLYAIHEKIGKAMHPDWSAPEFKEDTYIFRERDNRPVLVDAGSAHRKGPTLARYVEDVLNKRRKAVEPLRDMAFAVRWERGTTIPVERADKLLSQLYARGVPRE
jgi:hypothetical protein